MGDIVTAVSKETRLTPPPLHGRLDIFLITVEELVRSVGAKLLMVDRVGPEPRVPLARRNAQTSETFSLQVVAESRQADYRTRGLAISVV